MAWDSNRPVPWRRLIREWVIYTAVMVAVFVLFLRDQLSAGPFIGLLLSGPVYLALGAVLAKFGYQRTTMREARENARQRDAQRRAASPSSSAPAPRAKPAPTSRTAGSGQNRPPSSSRKRR
jgi:hypothetical protein